MIALTALSVCLLFGGVYAGNKTLQSKSVRLLELKVEDAVAEEQQASLIRAKQDIEQYAELEQIAKSIVPQDKDQARTVREIIKYADETGIAIQGISFPSSNLGTAAPAAPTTPAEGGTPPSPPAPGITQVKPVPGLTGVFQLELTVQSDTKRAVTFDRFVQFLDKLEQNRRTAQVTGLTITPRADNRQLLSFTLNINVFIKP